MSAPVHASGVGLTLGVQWRTGWKSVTAWVLGLVAIVVLTAASITSLYDTPEDLQGYAASSDTPALRMLNGDVAGLETLGGVLVNELGFVVAFAVPVLAIALTSRGTRKEEETGRLELLLASRMGRQAPLLAAVLLALATLLVIGALTSVTLLAAGADPLGSVLFGLDLLALGAVFVGVTAVLAQAFGHQRSVWGAALALTLASVIVRGLGSVDGTWVVWLSPHGWYDRAAPFGEPRVTPFVLAVVTTLALLALSLRLNARRDVGGALIAARTGPPRAKGALPTPIGLATREHRGVTLGWALLVGILMGTYGALTQTVIDAFAANPDLEQFIAGGEEGIVEAMAAMFVLMLGMLVSGYVLQALGSLRTEEISGRLELQLSQSRSRLGWLGPHLLVVAVGALVVGAVGALALAVTTAASLGDASWVATLLGAATAYLPVALLLGGLSVALFGWLPRLQPVAWAVFAIAAVVTYMGPGLDLPDALMQASPFGLVGNVPSEDLDVTGSLVAGIGGLALLGLGALGLTRRDVPRR